MYNEKNNNEEDMQKTQVINIEQIKEQLKEHENAGTPYDIMFEYTEKEILDLCNFCIKI